MTRCASQHVPAPPPRTVPPPPLEVRLLAVVAPPDCDAGQLQPAHGVFHRIMNQLHVSLYEHIAAARWKLVDQGFIDASHSSDGCRRVSVLGSSQFPAIFSFPPSQSVTRSGSWIQWNQVIDHRAATFAFRFASAPDADAFCNLLPRASILSLAHIDDLRSFAVEKRGGSMLKEANQSEKPCNAAEQSECLVDRCAAGACSAPVAVEAQIEARVPAYIQHICTLSHDLQCANKLCSPRAASFFIRFSQMHPQRLRFHLAVPGASAPCMPPPHFLSPSRQISPEAHALSSWQDEALAATMSVVRVLSDYVNRASEAGGSTAHGRATCAPRPAPASAHA
jgi:hypothetical protein